MQKTKIQSIKNRYDPNKFAHYINAYDHVYRDASTDYYQGFY